MAAKTTTKKTKMTGRQGEPIGSQGTGAGPPLAGKEQRGDGDERRSETTERGEQSARESPTGTIKTERKSGSPESSRSNRRNSYSESGRRVFVENEHEEGEYQEEGSLLQEQNERQEFGLRPAEWLTSSNTPQATWRWDRGESTIPMMEEQRQRRRMEKQRVQAISQPETGGQRRQVSAQVQLEDDAVTRGIAMGAIQQQMESGQMSATEMLEAALGVIKARRERMNRGRESRRVAEEDENRARETSKGQDDEEVLDWNTRVTVQKVRNEQLNRRGRSEYPDQGVRFDMGGQPYEANGGGGVSQNTGRRQSERRSAEKGEKGASTNENRGYRGGPPPDGGNGGDGDSEPSSEESSEEEGFGHKRRTPARRTSERPGGEREQSQLRYDAQRMLEGEARGGVSGEHVALNRYMETVRRRYQRMIQDKVGQALPRGINAPTKAKMPSPKAYEGKEDIEIFDEWVYALLRWLQLNQYGGEERDRERCTIVGLFLKGRAAAWFNDNIDGPQRKQWRWTFEEVIWGLYVRFIFQSSIQDAAERFNGAEFRSKNGVMALYHDLDRYATRMVKMPDSYTFKTTLVKKLPRWMYVDMAKKGITAESATVDEILRHARQLEEGDKLIHRYDNERRMENKQVMEAGSTQPAEVTWKQVYRPKSNLQEQRVVMEMEEMRRNQDSNNGEVRDSHREATTGVANREFEGESDIQELDEDALRHQQGGRKKTKMKQAQRPVTWSRE